MPIPLPGLFGDSFLKGIDTGSSMYSRIMQPILQREQLAQQKKLQESRLSQQQQLQSNQLAQALKFHMDNMALKKQQNDRLAANTNLNTQLLQQKLMSLQTPEQKLQAKISESTAIDDAKANRKKIDEIENTAKGLMPYAENVKTIEDILNAKPDLTGRTTGLADVLGLTKDEDVGKFISAAQNLQAHMARDMSSRGGYGVAKLVEQGKPNISKSGAFNKGVVTQLKEGMRNSFKQMNDDYLRLTGKKLPYDFDQFYKAQTENNASSNNQIAQTSQKRLKFNPVTGRLE